MLTVPRRKWPKIAAAAGLLALGLAALAVYRAAGVAAAIATLAAGAALLFAAAAIDARRRLREAEARARARLDDRTAAGRTAFLSWLNHELRSPLNACSMWLDVLALAPQPDKLAKAVDAIKRNLTRQARLADDLSDAAKVAADGIELRMTSLDFVALIKRGLDTWQPLALAKSLALESRIDVPLALVDGDEDRLAQALGHVMENAIGSTPSGGRVGLRVREIDGRCHVEVEDGGIAVSVEDAENLPTPLWRSPNSAKTRAGLGLGLAVAHHILTQHGGSLGVSSGAVGARFELTLPLAADGRQPDAIQLRARTRNF
jgi:signal transduction histidine kinase